MSPATAHIFRIVGAVALMFAVAGTVSADTRSGPPAPQCSEASFTNVTLPASAMVDEIRVIVAHHSPESGAAKISVGAGSNDRVVRVLGGSSRGLKFTSPLVGPVFSVELDPVFEAPRSACVERILLLRAGNLVASVTP